MWIIPVLGLICGALLGSVISLQIPVAYAKYLSIAVLAYLGDRLGVDLYTAAIIVFGIRIFSNLSAIRHLLMRRYIKSYPDASDTQKNNMLNDLLH